MDDRPARSARRDGRDGARRGLFERIMFSFMGPPQVGDVNEPRSVPVDPATTVCHKCGQPWDQHEIVRTGSMTYARCPVPPAELPESPAEQVPGPAGAADAAPGDHESP